MYRVNQIRFFLFSQNIYHYFSVHQLDTVPCVPANIKDDVKIEHGFRNI
jgi:hypothetical protein